MSSPLTPDVAFANLQATALTARCHNAIFRQKQLKALHDTVRNNTSAIRDAIRQDARVSEEEATIEVALALSTISEHHSSINTKKELEKEYRITNGKDADDERKPYGVAYIESQRDHTPFFSAIVALSAALAAGNCVALKLENNLRALPSLLRKLLPEALESDTFSIISSDPSQELLSTSIQILQDSNVNTPSYSQLVSSKYKVVAVVDRTADLALAAEHLVSARFAFGGSSPYAPDVVLVNEYIKKDFVEQVLKHSIRFLASSSNGSTQARDSKKSSPLAQPLSSLSSSKHWHTNTITSGDAGAILELSSLSSLPPKSSSPILSISAITSLEHAISLVDDDLSPQQTLLAAYHFGTPATGKYLSQYINADVSFINHIPFRILLGPAAPAHHPIDVEKRYSTAQFSRASPAYVLPPASQTSVSRVIGGKESRRAAAELLEHASKEIKEDKRATSIAIGYFEQGILIGLGVYGVPILACLGASLFFGVRAGLRGFAVI